MRTSGTVGLLPPWSSLPPCVAGRASLLMGAVAQSEQLTHPEPRP